MPFLYPSSPHQRRHGPQGYTNYESYKPWLRDEFSFRCVYCLVRERHYPNRDAGFSVDHLTPKSVEPELALEYENLVYACSRCNSYKGNRWPVPDPCATAYGSHLRVLADGRMEALSDQGQDLIDILDLNHPEQVQNRFYVLDIVRMLASFPAAESAERLRLLLGYPEDLPDLRRLRPPGGNTRREGVSRSHMRLARAR